MNAQGIKRSLEASGLRCTPQRYALMALLMECDRHPTAAEIFETVNRADPRSSRATIYNNLRDLVRAGLVREVAVEGRAARFDAQHTRHHHFVCDGCGNVEDVEWYDVPKPASQSLGKRVIRECELIFRGLCAKCAPRRAQRVRPRSQSGRHSLVAPAGAILPPNVPAPKEGKKWRTRSAAQRRHPVLPSSKHNHPKENVR